MRCEWSVAPSYRPAVALLGVLALSTFAGCGGGSSSPTVPPTPAPTATPAPTPTPVAPLPCNPTPPPLYGIKVKVHDDSGFRKILDSRPLVVNVDDYCGRFGFGTGQKFCFTRQENDPEAAACDHMAVGRAGDTGRDGPEWSWDGKPCTAEGDTVPGCRNHADNQFLVIAKGPGRFEACAAADVPLSQEPDRPGSRCGGLDVR
jgi:hypothetical protein